LLVDGVVARARRGAAAHLLEHGLDVVHSVTQVVVVIVVVVVVIVVVVDQKSPPHYATAAASATLRWA